MRLAAVLLALASSAFARGATSPAVDPLGLPPLPAGVLASNALAPPRVSGSVQFRETLRPQLGATATLPRARQEELHRPSYATAQSGGRTRAVLDYVERSNRRGPVVRNRSVVAQLQIRFF